MFTSTAAIVVDAPAKINLTLDVLGRRDDGYHTLCSVMQTLDLHDTLTLDSTNDDEITFTCDVPALQGDDNLVVRAAHLLRAHVGGTAGVRLGLCKRIPAEAGLGGGSSDTAAALRGLDRLWGLRLPTAELRDLGARLGSDVPFFFHAPTALVTGRGDVVETLSPAPPAHVVLYKPLVGVATGRVFAGFPAPRYTDDGATRRLQEALRAGLPPSRWPLSNGLQQTVAELYPEVAARLDALRVAGAPRPMMTGSGSTVYAIFDDAPAARAVYERLLGKGQGQGQEHEAILTRFALPA